MRENILSLLRASHLFVGRGRRLCTEISLLHTYVHAWARGKSEEGRRRRATEKLLSPVRDEVTCATETISIV